MTQFDRRAPDDHESLSLLKQFVRNIDITKLSNYQRSNIIRVSGRDTHTLFSNVKLAIYIRISQRT